MKTRDAGFLTKSPNKSSNATCSASKLDLFCKALASPVRLKLLAWLADPDQTFPQNDKNMPNSKGVCVDTIVTVLGLAQSTVSQHLQLLEQAGLIASIEVGRWRYVTRSESGLQDCMQLLHRSLRLPKQAALRKRHKRLA